MNPTTTSEATETTSRTGLALYRLSVRQYLRMIESGILPSGARVELLGGLLVRMMTKNTPHNFTTASLAELLRANLGSAWIVREEKSLILDAGSRPEPDVYVARGPRSLYRSNDPSAADVPLIVEVADSSYVKDRGVKLGRYAAAKIPVYWIVNLPESRVEVFTDPEGSGRSALYRTERLFDAASSVPIEIEGSEIGRIAVRDFLA